MSKIGRKIVKRLTDFANKVSGLDIDMMIIHDEKEKSNADESLINLHEIPKLNRASYLEACKQENLRLRQSYGPILITYIRKPQKLVLPPHKMNNDELIKFYRTNFQNTPVGCVVALRIDGDIHFGWSLCNKKDRFNKIISLNRAINRCFKDDLSMDAPPLVKNYLDRLWERANKYFHKSTT